MYIYMVTWNYTILPSIYPLYVSIYTIYGSYGICEGDIRKHQNQINNKIENQIIYIYNMLYKFIIYS